MTKTKTTITSTTTTIITIIIIEWHPKESKQNDYCTVLYCSNWMAHNNFPKKKRNDKTKQVANGNIGLCCVVLCCVVLSSVVTTFQYPEVTWPSPRWGQKEEHESSEWMKSWHNNNNNNKLEQRKKERKNKERECEREIFQGIIYDNWNTMWCSFSRILRRVVTVVNTIIVEGFPGSGNERQSVRQENIITHTHIYTHTHTHTTSTTTSFSTLTIYQMMDGENTKKSRGDLPKGQGS